MARSSGTEIEYPGELYVKNNSGGLDDPPQKQCLFLNGEAWSTKFDNTPNQLAPSDRLQLPSLSDWPSSPGGIGYDEHGDLRLGPDFDFGHDYFPVSQDGTRGPGLTLLAEILEAHPLSTAYTEEVGPGLETVVNLHLDLGHLYEANAVSAGRAAGHAWSHFGSSNPEQL